MSHRGWRGLRLGAVCAGLLGCVGGVPSDPRALPDFRASNGPSLNVDPQNPAIAIEGPLEVRFRGRAIALPDGASRSAIQFLGWLEHTPDLAKGLKDRRVLELGSGTGLAGLAALFLGASVDFTDQEPVMPVVQRNVTPNLRPAERTRVGFETLLWGHFHETLPLDQNQYDVVMPPALNSFPWESAPRTRSA